ncbi:MAG: hypothetical protein O3A95_01730 [Planctomycetota bacterium]|nr:hypothetical protein [Planctomycetota bacterium]MDA1113003.1 hypothetical protein [Planctomycetota bacterium]
MKVPPNLSLVAFLGLSLFGVSNANAQSVALQDDGQLRGPVLSGGGQVNLGTGCTDTWLTTHYMAGNGSGGNMFNITPNLDLTIECLDLHISTVGANVDVNLWYKIGTCVGFEGNSAAWTLLGNSNGISAGAGQPTNVSFAGNDVVFEAGVEYGIFVDVPTGSVSYTNGGPTIFSNSDLTLETFFGKSGWLSTFSFREWNGTLYYEPGAPSIAISGLFAGSFGTFEMFNLGEDTGGHFALSIAGFGTTPTVFGDLGLASPVFVIPPHPLIPDAAGTISLTITLPPNSLGRTIYVQGIELDGPTAQMTEPIFGVVQ